MNHFTSIYITILIRLVSTVHSMGPPEPNSPDDTLKGPGKSACRWWGLKEVECGTQIIQIDELPPDCTSLLYEGVRIDINSKITDYVQQSNGVVLGILDKLQAANRVYMFFGHTNHMEWVTALNVSDDEIYSVAQAEAESLKGLLEQNSRVLGIILINLEEEGLYELTGNLKIYIEVMKETIANLEIGLNIDSYGPIHYLNNPDAKWLDFEMLDASFDFYVLNVIDINNCTDEYVGSGVYPLTGNDSSITSVDTIRNYLECVGVRTSDLYYNYQLRGEMKNPTDDDECTTFYTTICTNNTKEVNSNLCADTLETYYKKGQYASAKGKGFIVTIDVDDIDGSCQCGRTFPGFYALLDGFNGESPPEPCPLFDRC